MDKSNKDSVIIFTAEISKVATLADGGIRITLDLAETEIETATKMMQVRQAGGLLEIAAIPVNKKKNGRKPRKTERKSREIEGDISATY